MTTPDTDAFDYAAFGDEVRTFATEHCPQDIRRTVASGARIGRHEYSSWQKILFRKGWAAPGWPREHGGTGAPCTRVSLAKINVGEAARFVAQSTIQVHGGMGMTEDLKAARLAKCALMADFEFGDRHFHLQRARALAA